MSIISTQANYGGRQPNNTSYIKQFVVSPSNKTIPWVIKTISNVQYIEPAITNKPISISQDVYVNNLTVEGTFQNLSDIRLKENIKNIDINNVLPIINSMNPCQYSFKKSKDNNKIHYGLIAQELETICPELVGHAKLGGPQTYNSVTNTWDEHNPTGIKTVNYLELIPLLLSNIQYLNKKVEENNTQIDLLNEQIERLTSTLSER